MNNKIRKKHTGEPGNGGQFGTAAKGEPGPIAYRVDDVEILPCGTPVEELVEDLEVEYKTLSRDQKERVKELADEVSKSAGRLVTSVAAGRPKDVIRDLNRTLANMDYEGRFEAARMRAIIQVSPKFSKYSDDEVDEMNGAIIDHFRGIDGDPEKKGWLAERIAMRKNDESTPDLTPEKLAQAGFAILSATSKLAGRS